MRSYAAVLTSFLASHLLRLPWGALARDMTMRLSALPRAGMRTLGCGFASPNANLYISPCQLFSTPISSSRAHMSTDNDIPLSPKARRIKNVGTPKGAARLDPPYSLGSEAASGLPFTDRLNHHPFKVLGIETSCDDTAVAVVTSAGEILSNVVVHQHEIHAQFGGVVPGLARDAHVDNLEQSVQRALEEAGLSSAAEVDAIAVTLGPGLEICLRVGFRKAFSLAQEYKKPFACVHHLEAHCLVARLAGKDMDVCDGANVSRCSDRSSAGMPHFIPVVEYPFLALLVSGGHTQLMLVEDMGKYTLVGGTLDDALGEAFDKAARMLNVGHKGTGDLGREGTLVGGAAIEMLARYGDPHKFVLPVPMRSRKDCDFSYAGLKNSFRMLINEQKALIQGLEYVRRSDVSKANADSDFVLMPDELRCDLAAAFQHTAFTHLEEKLKRGIQLCEDRGLNMSALVVVGGVAANQDLRGRLASLTRTLRESKGTEDVRPAMRVVFPPPVLCTDNAVMCAWAGIEKLLRGVSDSLNGQEDVRARWPLGTMLAPEK